MKTEITKEEFEEFERVRQSGRTNMYDVDTVIALSHGLTREKCIQIMKGYSELKKKYMEARE